jgi:hypothetical protein
MEQFEVVRGLVKQVTSDGGLAKLAKSFFEEVNLDGENSFEGSHGIMSSLSACYNEAGKLEVEVVNDKPDFDDPEAMKAAMDCRKRWTEFLDAATGYNSKKRGDKAKEWIKKASKAKSAVKNARHMMKLAKKLSDEDRATAEGWIVEIEEALAEKDNTRAAGRAEKLTKLLNS